MPATPSVPAPQTPRRPVLEIAVQDVAGVRIASRVGAARAELCVALGATGGLTPSVGLLEGAVAAALAAVPRDRLLGRLDGAYGEVSDGSSGGAEDGAYGEADDSAYGETHDEPHASPTRLPDGRDPVGIHPLIRCRAGGFVYDADELDVHLRDVRALVRAGASGVVVGALTLAGEVDAGAVSRLVDAADGAEVTFHRAVDVLADPSAAVEVLCGLGVTRVLTSGGAARSIDGVARLARMVEVAAGRLQVMAGGGVRAVDVAALLAAGVDAVHLSAKGCVAADGGVGGGAGACIEVTDPEVAEEAAHAFRAAAAAL